MIKKSTIPTILGIIVLLAGTFLGVFYLNMTQIFRIGASPETSPKDVRVSNIADNTITISWTTGGLTSDFLTWGETQNSTPNVVKEDISNSKYFTHSITVNGLAASTSYFYKINSNGTTYDNNGIPWQFTTGPALNINTSSFPISGSVITASGTPEKRALVYLNVGGYLQSTLTSDTGNFVLQLGQVRTPDLQNYATIDPAKTLLEISVDAGGDGTSTAQIFPQSAQPVPPMVLGQVYDLRSLQPTQGGQNPSVNLQLPEGATAESKFNTATGSGSSKPVSVILENITEGEVITTTEPQFFGKGPEGTAITITVNSEVPITGTVQIPSNGSWSWTPPAGLTPGPHSITITWKDVTGITRSLTRNFIVQAGEVPAFTASQSATPTATPTVIPTATPISTPRPTTTPTPTPSPTISPTLSPTASPTTAPVPVTGNLTPTLLLSIMGVLVLIFSFSVWKTAKD